MAIEIEILCRMIRLYKVTLKVNFFFRFQAWDYLTAYRFVKQEFEAKLTLKPSNVD